MKISVIIPVYRGKEILSELFRRIDETLVNGYDYEVIFVCDGCDLISSDVAEALKINYPDRVKVYHLAHNYGQHRAIQFGFSKASGDYFVTMDEDLQHNPADILKMIKKKKESGFDIVYGRFADPQHSDLRNKFSAWLRKILKHFIPTLYEEYSPYRLIKKDIASMTATMVSPYIFIDDFLSRVTQNIGFADVSHSKRLSGKSSYTLIKLVKHGFYIFLAYSRIISWLLGFAAFFIMLGTLLMILDLFESSTGKSGRVTSFIELVIFGAGLLLVITGLIGSLINYRKFKQNAGPVETINEGTI